MAGLFIRWLNMSTLEDAGYITVVGLRLLLRWLTIGTLEWLMISAIALIFAWEFSKRTLTTYQLKS